MEQTRWLAMYSILPHHDAKKHGKLKPTDILRFPWDDVPASDDDMPQKEKEEIASKRWRQIGPMKTKR